MKIEQIKAVLEENHINTKTLEVSGQIGSSVIYNVAVPAGRKAMEAWLDLQYGFDGYYAFISGEWSLGIDQEREQVTKTLNKARRLTGSKILKFFRDRFDDDWKWYGHSEQADDGIPVESHGPWPKKVEPLEGFTIPRAASKVQMMFTPMKSDLDALAWHGFGDRHGFSDPETHVAMLRHWHKTFDIELVGMRMTEFEVMVSKPPTNRKAAMELAREQFFYCPHIVTLGTKTVEKLAAQLLNSHVWHFWWDTSALQRRKGSTKNMTAKESWQAYYDKNIDDWKEILTWDPYEDWDISRCPEGEAQRELERALTILYSGKGTTYAKKYLKLASDRLERAFKENKFKTKPAKENYPQNEALANRTLNFVRAITANEFSADLVIDGSNVLVKEASKGKWSDISQAEYLTTVRLALICGDRPLAAKRLATKKSFTPHKQQHAILKKIAATDGDLPFKDEKLLAKFDEWFDDLRHAAYTPEMYLNKELVRFEAAAIRYKYFASKNGEIDWKKVIKQVTR